jgi:hypothetical protein
MAALDLRPLSLGELLDRTFSLYRKHFFLFVGIAAIPYSFFFIINLAFSLLPIFAGAARNWQAEIAERLSVDPQWTRTSSSIALLVALPHTSS